MPTTDPSPLSPKEQIKEQLEEQVIKLLAEGVSQDKVAELTGMCRATQYNRIYKNPDFRRRLLEEKRRLYEERTAQISSAIPNAIEELRRIASGKADNENSRPPDHGDRIRAAQALLQAYQAMTKDGDLLETVRTLTERVDELAASVQGAGTQTH